MARRPFQGVIQIVRFNRHFYIAAAAALLAVVVLNRYMVHPFLFYINAAALLGMCLTMLSLLGSWYVYDLSGLYRLEWLELPGASGSRMVNIHAGFDETSALLRRRYPGARLEVLDFYDPAKHTEISVRRARKAYSPFPGTQAVPASALPLGKNAAERIFVLFAAHEIRDEKERSAFFKELGRVLEQDGKIIVAEHLRDVPNALLYTIGSFHFYPESSWRRVFDAAGLEVLERKKVTPFITIFTLGKHQLTY